MTDCQHCKRPTQLYLCTDCTTQLTEMIAQIPWLLHELDARIQRLDRTNLGTIGRNRRPDELNVMDFDAAETARHTEQTIRDLVTTINGPGHPIRLQCTVTHDYIGPLRPAWRRLPYGYRPTLIELIDWLTRRVDIIARHKKAGHIYRELNKLVGSDQQGGQLVTAINPTEHHLVGPCPTITGRHHNGTPRQCGHTLFADTYDRTVTCPTCQQNIDVETTRRRAAETRDLQTKTELIDILTNIDEPVEETRINQWIKARRLRSHGYLHDGTITAFEIDPDNDQPVYSVERARKLRRRDQQLTKIRAKVRAT
jgi:uncharacterized Zn finger protein (UPF0148 family)